MIFFHGETQTPLTQRLPLAQITPHFPQLLLSLLVSTHWKEAAAEQLVGVAPGHTQLPAWQVDLRITLLHRRPHAPQLLESLLVLMQVPLHKVCIGSAHSQEPESQIVPLEQTTPQEPQLLSSLSGSVQTPPQSIFGVRQVGIVPLATSEIS